MAKRVPGPTIVIDADDRKVSKAFRDLNSRIRATNQKLQSFGRIMGRAFAGLAAAGGLALREFATFERSMVHTGKLMNANAGEFKDLTAAARKFGAETEHSATAAAEGLKFFALAGFSAGDAITALPHALNLATIGELDLGRATDLLTDTMTAFGAEADEAERYVDAFGKASSLSNQSVEQIGAAMEKGAPAARAFGLDIEETTAALGLFANAGSKGERAGTLLQSLIIDLQKNSDALREHNIEVYDAAGAYRPLVDIIRDFEAAVDGKTDAERQSIISTLGNRRATRALELALTQGSDAYAGLTDEIRKSSGFTREYAEELLGTMIGELKQLKSAASEAGIAFAEDIAPAILGLIQSFTRLLEKFNSLSDKQRKAISTGIVMAARFTAVAASAAFLLRGVNALIGGLGLMRIALIKGKWSWRAFWGAATVGLAFAIPLLIEGFLYLRRNWDSVSDAMLIAGKRITRGVLDAFDLMRLGVNAVFAHILENAANTAAKVPLLGKKIAESLRLAARAQRADNEEIIAGIEAREEAYKNYAATIRATTALEQADAAARSKEGAPGAVDTDALLGGDTGGAEQAELDADGNVIGRGGAAGAALEVETQLEHDLAKEAAMRAHLERITGIRHDAGTRDGDYATREREREAREEEAARRRSSESLEAGIKEKLAGSKRGAKLLNAWQKVQMLRDLAMSVATRAPEAFMTTSAKYPWPLGGILGALHAAAIVGQGAVGKGAISKFATGGIVPGSGRGDIVPAMLEPGEGVISRAAMAKMLGGGGGGGAKVLDLNITIPIDGQVIAHVVERINLED